MTDLTKGARVLVTGASGNVGRGVVDGLVAAGVPVRAATSPRHVSDVVEGGGGAAPATRGTHRAGGRAHGSDAEVERVDFDYTDSSTWPAAFAGVEQMFVMRPPHLSRPRSQMLPALEAARAAGVRHMVLLSLQGAERNRLVPHAALEEWMRRSGPDWTFVRPSFFMQNLTTTHLTDIRDRGELVVPAGGGATAFVDAVDVAAVATAALLDPAAHRGRAWTPTGPAALTYHEATAILSHTLGRQVSYRRPGLARYARHARSALGLPWGMVAVTSAIYTVARLGRAAGLTDDVRTVTGAAPTSLEEFVGRNAHLFAPTHPTG